MSQYPPPYSQSEGMSNPHYMGPNPTYPNEHHSQYQKPAGSMHQSQHAMIHASQMPQPQPYPPEPYPAQPQSYPAQQQPTIVTATQFPGTSVHVVSATTAIPAMVTRRLVGPYPSTINCPNCHEDVTTVVRTESGVLAWISCGVCCLFGCWLGCCLIPFCVDACKDAYHTCPRCNTFVGKYTRLR